jgi:hypothetical protein
VVEAIPPGDHSLAGRRVHRLGLRHRDGTNRPSSRRAVILFQPGEVPRLVASRKRLEYLAIADLDTVVFQQLPMHIRSRVLREGAVLFARDEDALYELALRTARAFSDFRHIQRAYLDEVARG